eukprot:1572495-Rhodomonas_salina.1
MGGRQTSHGRAGTWPSHAAARSRARKHATPRTTRTEGQRKGSARPSCRQRLSSSSAACLGFRAVGDCALLTCLGSAESSR